MMVLTVIIIGWLSLQFSQHNYLPLRQRNLISNYGVMAVITYQVGDKPALKRWFEELSEHFATKAYLLDENGNDVLGRQLPHELEKISRQIKMGELAPEAIREADIIISPIIRGNQQHEYRFVSRKELTLAALQYFHLSGFIFGLLIAIIIAGLVCYFLSRYLMHPIQVLTIAVRQLGQGDLQTRVVNRFDKRNDEIGELASEFNSMAEQLQVLIATQRRLLQDVSHELRTPLARLQIALALARKQVDGRATKELQRIELESERLDDLIGQILSLARMNSKEYQMLFEDLDLVTLIQDIVSDIAYEDTQKAERIHLQLSDDCQIYGDAKLLRSAIENVLRNALRYTDNAIDIHLHHTDDDINLSIRDYGPGVSEEKLESLFKSFYRVDDARNQQRGGYGLGLAIAKRAIDLHNGTINANNAKDGGLIINIDLSSKR